MACPGSQQAAAERMNGLVPQHWGPHLSWEKAMGAARPSFSVGPLPGNDPHAAFGKLHRMPVHRPPFGPLQHFLTQPSRALQGTSVHPVQRRGRQTVLHVSLRGHIHTNTGGLAGLRGPAPARGRTQGLDLPGDRRPRLRPTRFPAGLVSGAKACARSPSISVSPSLARNPSPNRPLKAHALSARSSREGWAWSMLRRRSRPLAVRGRGAWRGR